MTKLKELPLEDRPRERLSRHGVEALSSIELLAILLGSGTKSCSVLQLSQELLAHFGSLLALSEATLSELKEVKGIGTAKAVQLQAAFALHRRIEEKERGPLLDTSEKIYELIRHDLEDLKAESLMIILRDVRSRLIHRELLSKGTLTELILHPREIFHTAIRHRAHNVVLAHNHPSGDPHPSPRDLETTRLLQAAGRVVGIELADHLIVGKGSFVSLQS